jgi:DNA-binding response OmpR family regulator
LASIIVIDDDPQVLETIVEMLRQMGHDVVGATDADVAISQFSKAPTDLVITDIVMPNKDGFETIQAFRRSHNDVKILAVSGGGRFGQGSFLKEAKLFGADLALMKPFTQRELRAAVDALVEPEHAAPEIPTP